jgi:putative transport protein
MDFSAAQSAALDIFAISATILTGLALGSVKIRGIGPGSTGVLFAGIVFGHLGLGVKHDVLEFVRDFGLILFVFTIGLQLGPGFFASLRNEGLRLNLLAAGIVAAGAGVTIGAAVFLPFDSYAGPGLFAGASTNTPSLGAAQETIRSIAHAPPSRSLLLPLAYAISYPAGIAGIIGTLLFLKAVFRVDLREESLLLKRQLHHGIEPLERMSILVDNPNMDGAAISDIPGRRELGIMISRIRRAGEQEVHTARHATIIHTGDAILAVGTADALTKFCRVLGKTADLDLVQAPGSVANRRVVATNKSVLGKTLREIGLDHIYGVTVTRVTRADLEMTAVSDLRLQFGDMVQIVGEEENLETAAKYLGNSLRALNETNFLPVFIGVALGVLAGNLPISLPGLPVPVKLGIAGGPLLLAILLGRIGKIGPLVWYMPVGANLAFRDMGISLFLACVGLKAGEHFVEVAWSANGLIWLCAGLLITVLPLLIAGIIARKFMGLNFLSIIGMLSGSMTDPPALAFSNAIAGSDAPSVAYATVYPLTMLLRILSAQVLVLVLCR